MYKERDVKNIFSVRVFYMHEKCALSLSLEESDPVWRKLDCCRVSSNHGGSILYAGLGNLYSMQGWIISIVQYAGVDTLYSTQGWIRSLGCRGGQSL